MLSCSWVEQKASAEEETADNFVEYYSDFCLNLPALIVFFYKNLLFRNGPHFLSPTVLFLISVLMCQKDSRIRNEDTKEINLIPVHGFLP